MRGFALAGKDRRFHWAEATITGNEVTPTSPAVPRPIAARYDWDASPLGNLYNADDLPAFPFRSDEWDTPATRP